MNKRILFIDGLRTPFGSIGGVLSSLSAPQLAAPLLSALVSRAGLSAKCIDEVILGQVIQGGVGQAPARQAMRLAALDDQTRAMTINKVCGSGLKALLLGGQSILLGESDLVLAGGMESMSQAPYIVPKARQGLKAGDGQLIDLLFYDALTDPYSGKPMGELVEEKTQNQGITREAQDQYAIKSYQRALAAQTEGRLAREILPVKLESKKGEVVVSQDEEPAKVDFAKLSSLRPVFSPSGSITAANASSINDGAAVTLLASEEAAMKYGLKPKAELIAWSHSSHHPDDFSLAPIGAINKLLKQTLINPKEVDLWEINEAFAAVPLMALGPLALDLRQVNVNGGAVSLGHPVGASGGRLALTLVEELTLRQGRYGIAALCIGGGEAVAALFKRWEG
ncbi:MAG: acetyl-CoA acetyltransferase [Candidatus Lambdaproteobacteria bacterium RIFOXYD2_FULL_50_16]|uniref:acetyl-CoA C-acetyltransferase n=1 Tax=Candidatus Lambdaproteobacteria bacterium RIFOXYD2_FULL_50_16 TaxID=1817772 RepID=A0A1F6G8N5_9PROT|nr:MAG: acetyl-CoA acetyltransferase [Candidatus Lambdaproteobacteria bacterium RIFOXYD2_FULL_50_16]